MKLWQELVSTAVVGTDRQKFLPPANGGGDELGAVLGRVKGGDDETVLLKAAAVLGAYRRAGTRAVPGKHPAAPELAPPETAAPLGEQTTGHLASMLGGIHPEVLPEFLRLAAEHKRILPAEFLPEILETGNDRRDLRLLILPVIGERGRWLAQYNPAWRWALVERAAEEVWGTGDRPERLFAFAFLRRQNAEAARRILDADWKGESAKDRAALLEILRTNLGPADEPFLEEVLRGDKSADVRRVAFDLLANLPESRLVQELTRRAQELVGFQKGGIFTRPKIQVNLPDGFDKLPKDDFLNSCGLQFNREDVGQKAVNLARLLSVVSPSVWENRFSATPAEIIGAAKSNDWDKALLAGFAAAAERRRNGPWLKEVLRAASGQKNRFHTFYSNHWGMPENMTPDLIEELFFESGGEDLAFPHLHRSPWGDEFTRRVVGVVKAGSRKSKEQWNLIRGCAYGLKDFALFMPVKLTDEIKAGWKFEDEADRHIEPYVNQFLDVLQFRREIHDSFEREE